MAAEIFGLLSGGLALHKKTVPACRPITGAGRVPLAGDHSKMPGAAVLSRGITGGRARAAPQPGGGGAGHADSPATAAASASSSSA